MHIDRFMPLLLERVQITSQLKSHMPIEWCIYEAYAELTAFIDYGCGFANSVGTCKKYASWAKLKQQDVNYRTKHRSLKACCSNCASFIGHLDFVRPDWEILRTLARSYNKVDGFWRTGVGCILPRKHRSITCLKYCCGLQLDPESMTPDRWLIKFFNEPDNFKWSYQSGLLREGKAVVPVPSLFREILITGKGEKKKKEKYHDFK